MKTERDEEAEAFLRESSESEDVPAAMNSQRTAWARSRSYIRFFFELAMAATIVFLIFFRAPPTKTLRRTPVPDFPRKTYTFHNDPKYTREDMFLNESTTLRTLHNWIPLSSESRGYVVIPDLDGPYDLPEPDQIAIDRHNDGPGFMMSVFHQLHCLSYLAEYFQRGYGGHEMTKEVSHHTAHCFNYIRQGITCNADLTLEGKTDAGPGEGSEHECVDYDALLEWANKHAAYRWRNGLLPEDAIL
ncbi:hypothetical protein DE146DRAFT_642107 [Phaeosphaeria sp. MPI-PUGE-AT-0046c]|nr:hypothetical protein DE146DRAFT_642107 [Phaeosphaeria sp. MPI-PUGE-AT-0046c]